MKRFDMAFDMYIVFFFLLLVCAGFERNLKTAAGKINTSVIAVYISVVGAFILLPAVNIGTIFF